MNNKLKLELIWWLATLVLLMLVLLPIFSAAKAYPFWIPNIVFVLVFTTFTRYIFFLQHTFLGQLQWAKVVLLVLCIPLVIYLFRQLHSFEIFVDEVGLLSLFSQATDQQQGLLAEYTKAEMLFFGVGSIASTIMFPIRMVISFWRTYNLGTA